MVRMQVRSPAVAGMFYPDDAATLRGMVRRFLAEAPAPEPDPVAMVAPHAGFIYSGYTAACGYRALTPVAADGVSRRVFLLGPSHRVYLEGASVGDYDAFLTPLGLVEVDREMAERVVAAEPDVSRELAPHQLEHSLEVHLPFLQETLGHFRIVPLVYGRIEPRRLMAILERHLEAGDLVVASSDLSHFYSYEQARTLDAHCHVAVLERRPEGMDRCEACGGVGITALLGMARQHHWRTVLADYRNSGDTAGDRQRVVGYASYLFYPN